MKLELHQQSTEWKSVQAGYNNMLINVIPNFIVFSKCKLVLGTSCSAVIYKTPPNTPLKQTCY